MATFAYGRVSTTEQTTENQKLEIQAAGYTIDFWFADEGVSGSTQASQRPQFSKMLDKIRDGERLVVTKLDRLGRDAQDVGATIKALAARRIEVIVLQLGKLDLTSPAGKLMLTMLAAMAEMERDLLIERTQAGLARAKAEGKTLGRPSKTTPAMRMEVQAKYAEGRTITELAKEYSLSRGSIHNLLKPGSVDP
ncbi:recombinase family protein [Noviherbaspirillum aridicola]|uniref:Resolvase n=1 Tax=Noviherbaspirillum aridicola TaxID=2849687 RepID=A0ABQ4QAE1_9BURK|nr:recombinase family protein [Noviherbaspirillum aridicola]GIZ54041.1 resolvase [Noviherbaspirillum aridicola]